MCGSTQDPYSKTLILGGGGLGSCGFNKHEHQGLILSQGKLREHAFGLRARAQKNQGTWWIADNYYTLDRNQAHFSWTQSRNFPEHQGTALEWK